MQIAPRYACQQTTRPTDPSTRPTSQSTECNRDSCMPVGRALGRPFSYYRSTELALCMLCTLVDRAVGGHYCWPAIQCILALSLLPTSTLFLSMSLKNSTIVFIFSLPTILYLGEDFLNLSRIQHNTCRLESGAPVWLPTYLAQGIKSSIVHLNELHRTQAI